MEASLMTSEIMPLSYHKNYKKKALKLNTLGPCDKVIPRFPAIGTCSWWQTPSFDKVIVTEYYWIEGLEFI